MLTIDLLMLLPYSVCAFAFFTYLNAATAKKTVRATIGNHSFIFEITSAIYEYIIYIMLIITGLSCAAALLNISGHTIISLDIIYFFSILILIMLHIFKEPSYSCCK